jgi:hypothetical protein
MEFSKKLLLLFLVIAICGLVAGSLENEELDCKFSRDELVDKDGICKKEGCFLEDDYHCHCNEAGFGYFCAF